MDTTKIYEKLNIYEVDKKAMIRKLHILMGKGYVQLSRYKGSDQEPIQSNSTTKTSLK